MLCYVILFYDILCYIIFYDILCFSMFYNILIVSAHSCFATLYYSILCWLSLLVVAFPGHTRLLLPCYAIYTNPSICMVF